MNLEEALKRIQFDGNWEVYAELVAGELKENSDARFGQSCFENGGLLDDKVFVCNGDTINDFLSDWVDDGELVSGWFDEFIDPLNEAKEWAEEYAV